MTSPVLVESRSGRTCGCALANVRRAMEDPKKRLGAAVGVATLACFAAFGIEGSAVRLALIYPFFPICQALSLSNSMTNGLRSLPEELQADGNAAFNTLQQLGGAIGTAVAAAIVNSAQADSSGDLVAGTTAGAQAGISPQLLLAANEIGGGIGKIVSPQNLAIAATAIKEPGSESPLLRRAAPYSIAFVALLGMVVVLASSGALGFLVAP